MVSCLQFFVVKTVPLSPPAILHTPGRHLNHLRMNRRGAVAIIRLRVLCGCDLGLHREMPLSYVKHLANINKRQHLFHICMRFGLTPPQIVTPDLLWETFDE